MKNTRTPKHGGQPLLRPVPTRHPPHTPWRASRLKSGCSCSHSSWARWGPSWPSSSSPDVVWGIGGAGFGVGLKEGASSMNCNSGGWPEGNAKRCPLPSLVQSCHSLHPFPASAPYSPPPLPRSNPTQPQPHSPPAPPCRGPPPSCSHHVIPPPPCPLTSPLTLASFLDFLAGLAGFPSSSCRSSSNSV